MGYQCPPVRSNLYLLRKKLPAIEGINLFGSQSATGYCLQQTVLAQEVAGIAFVRPCACFGMPTAEAAAPVSLKAEVVSPFS